MKHFCINLYLFKLTLDERKTLTKVSTCKTSHNHSPKQSAHSGRSRKTSKHFTILTRGKRLFASTLVFLRGNRCLFTINWTHIPDSISVWENLLSDVFDRRIQTQVGHYRFTYMLSHVGPKYDDLVNVYCHAHWGSPHPSFRREDVWEAGALQPMEHPEMLYLPPNLPRSTPKKPELVRNPTEGDLPDLEEMGHHELIDLVKKLLVERASKPTSLTNPNKDATVAGHVSVNQESLVQSSQAILQGLAEGGYIHAKTPKFESFFDDKKNKLDFDMWERQVLSAATTHSGTAVK